MFQYPKMLISLLALLLFASTIFSTQTYSDDALSNEDATSETVVDEFTSSINGLNGKSFNDKIDALKKIQNLRDDRSLEILQAFLDGNLFEVKADKTLVIKQEVVNEASGDTEDVYITAIEKQSVVVENKRDVKKVRSNNRLRRELRTVIAGLELNSSSKEKRLQAAKNLIKNRSDELNDLIRQAHENETDSTVKSTLSVALAMIDIESEDKLTKLNAIETLSKSLEPEALAALNNVIEADNENADADVQSAAEAAAKKINSQLNLYSTFENIFFGVSLGSVLLLAAVGLAITFGVMGVINMAHGEMIMLGAYTTFAIQQLFPNFIELSLLMAIPAAFLVSGSMGMLIERLVIRHLYGRPLETLLATFGVSLILQQAVRMYRANNVPVITPEWMSGSFEINAALSLTFNRFYIIWFCFIVVIGLMMLMRHTFFGLQMRAVTQNRMMANSMGIRSGWVDALTFGLGSGVAGIAGVALSQLTNVGPNLGQGYIIDSFMVVVFGGVGNLFGTVFAAMSLGIVNKFLEPVAGAVLGKIFVLIFIILFIQWRPRGLFALKGRFVED